MQRDFRTWWFYLLALGASLVTASPMKADGTCGFPPFPATFDEIFGDLKSETWPECGGGEPPPSCTCSDFFDPLHCGDPQITIGYELNDPLCDPASTSCTVRLTIDVVQPGIEDSEVSWDPDDSPTPLLYWWDDRAIAPTCGWQFCSGMEFTCGFSGSGGRIRSDTYEITRFLGGVTCGNARAKLEAARLFVCPTSGGCGVSRALNGLGGKPMAAAIGCPIEPPMDDGTCELSGGGAGSVAIGGGGSRQTFPGSGPGARLSYYSGGAGGVGLPGAGAWNTALGRHWSHDYAERIVDLGDDAWLITEKATFRKFSNPDGSGVYQEVAPVDERRTLTCLDDANCSGGWQLLSLDGTVKTFNPDGTWHETLDPNGNPTTATYTSDQLTQVTFPDERSETFTYHPDGKLASITEHGISGNPVRTWSYIWDGDDLVRVDRPDGTAVRFAYSSVLGGYMTRRYEVATDDSERIVRAWMYEAATGHVLRTWSGAESFDDETFAVDKYEFVYSGTDPLKPTSVGVTGPNGGLTTYSIEQSLDKPRLTSRSGTCSACGLGPQTSLTYGDASNPYSPTQITDGNGNITEIDYDPSSGAPTQRVEDVMTQMRTVNWVYDDPDFPTKPTEEQRESVDGTPMGRTTTFVFDSAGNVTDRTIAGVEEGTPFSYLTEAFYNPEGRPTTIDPPGYTTTDQTTFTYDPARGNLLPLTRIDPLVGTTTFKYDDLNRRTSVTDPNGVETVTVYDLMDRVTSITQAAGTAEEAVTTYEYNVFGDLFRVTLPEGNVIEYKYDPIGWLQSIERKPDAATPGERTFYTHDGAGNRTSEQLQEWDGSAWVTVSQTGFAYGAECRLTSTSRGGAETHYEYDCNGNLEHVWDANHDFETDPPTTVYGYDALDRLTSVTQPWGGAGGGNVTTTYGYDVQDHLTSVTDGEGNTTTYEYSDRDLLTEEDSPVSGITGHTYNEHGELTSTTDARSVTVTRTVDAADRVTAVTHPTDTTLDIAYGHDTCTNGQGRLCSIARNGQSIDYAYDLLGRVTQDGDLTYGYDSNGNRTAITYPGGVTATYTYDFADRQETLTVDDGINPPLLVASGATYEPSGPLTALNLANGVTETRFFDNRYTLDILEVSNLAGPEPVLDFDYAADGVGNVFPISAGRCDDLTLTDPYTAGALEQACGIITAEGTVFVDTAQEVKFEAGQKVVLQDGFSVKSGSTFKVNVMPGFLAQETYTFNYQDFQYFLTQGDGPWGTLSWSYDKIGNRLTETRDGNTDTYSYTSNGSGNAPILESIDLAAPLGIRSFTHGAAGHLEEVDSAGNVIDLSYDEAGRMNSIDRASASESVDTFYDGRSFLSLVERPISGPDLAATEPTYSSEGLLHCVDRQVSSTATPEKTYYFYLAGRPVAQLLSDGITSTWTYLTTDHLGTPLIATDSAGDVIWQGPLEPFGKDWQENSASGALENGLFLRFPGQWEDGRWEDAASAAGTYYNVHRWYLDGVGRYGRVDPIFLAGYSPYVYGLSSPTVITDPLGLLPGATPEEECFFCTIYAESRGQSPACQKAVASVIVNRLARCRNAGVPTTICSIVAARGQFDGFFDRSLGQPNPNYQDCANCIDPKNFPELADLMNTFSQPFDVEPDADFFANNTPPVVRNLKKNLNADPVPFAQCNVFFFMRTRDTASGTQPRPTYCR